MALFGNQQRKIGEGQFTQTLYTLIKEQKYNEAIAHLNIELQVMVNPPSACSACTVDPAKTPAVCACRTPRRTGLRSPSWGTALTTVVNSSWHTKCGCCCWPAVRPVQWNGCMCYSSLVLHAAVGWGGHALTSCLHGVLQV